MRSGGGRCSRSMRRSASPRWSPCCGWCRPVAARGGDGLLTLPAALPTLAGGPISGWLVATRGPRGVLAASTFTMCVALAALALLPGDAPIAAYLACYLLLGIGYGVLNAPLSTVAVA